MKTFINILIRRILYKVPLFILIMLILIIWIIMYFGKDYIIDYLLLQYDW